MRQCFLIKDYHYGQLYFKDNSKPLLSEHIQREKFHKILSLYPKEIFPIRYLKVVLL